jgi:membrane fusion protein, multidrug efflux system
MRRSGELWRVPGRRKAGFGGPALLVFLLVRCGEENAYVPPPPPTVIVAPPVQQTVTETIELTGSTQSTNSVDLVARVVRRGLHRKLRSRHPW